MVLSSTGCGIMILAGGNSITWWIGGLALVCMHLEYCTCSQAGYYGSKFFGMCFKTMLLTIFDFDRSSTSPHRIQNDENC